MPRLMTTGCFLLKMLYEDKIKKYRPQHDKKLRQSINFGDRTVQFMFNNDMELKGQIAIFQFRAGYDKALTSIRPMWIPASL